MRALVVTLAILFGIGTARADEREIARAEFTLGQAADREGHYQEAIEHYQRANDKLPHPFTSFNIAVDFEKLGKPREAATWYRRYLAQITDAAEKAKTEALIEKLRTRPGIVVVRTRPAGARIYVDGKPVGVTPYQTTLPGGLHLVGVVLDGQNEQRDVSTEYGERQELDIRIRRGDGQLVVTGSPPGALVTIDGEPAGTLPTTTNLEAGRHHVHVSAYGLPAWDRDVDVRADDTVTLGVKLDSSGPEVRDGPPGESAPAGTPPPAHPAKLSYVVGGAGGTEARGSGAIGLFELGLRYSQLQMLLQLGKGGGGTMFALLIRYSFLPARLSPYIGAGYAGIKRESDDQTNAGLAGEVGLHLDVMRSEHATVAAVLSAGAFYYGRMGGSDLAVAVPVTVSIEGSFGN